MNRTFKVIGKKELAKKFNLDKDNEIFCEVTVTSPPTGVKKRGKFCPSYFSGGLTEVEAKQLYYQLQEVLNETDYV